MQLSRDGAPLPAISPGRAPPSRAIHLVLTSVAVLVRIQLPQPASAVSAAAVHVPPGASSADSAVVAQFRSGVVVINPVRGDIEVERMHPCAVAHTDVTKPIPLSQA